MPTMTYEEKVAVAQGMRAKSVFHANLPEALQELYRQTQKEERYIPTSQGDCHIHLYYPAKKPAGKLPLYINFHGGGFVRQWRENDALFCCKLVAETGCACVDVDYKLAPEHPYPTAVKECHDAIQWIFENADELGIDTDNVVVGGHSAGGNLTAVTSMMAAKTGAFRVKYLIMDYPGVDNHKDPSLLPYVEEAIPVERMRQFMALYHESPETAKEPYSSPLLADDDDLKALPPTTVITAEKDNLRDDGEAFAHRLVELGIPVTVRRFLKSRHGFMINFVDEYEEAMRFYTEILKAAFQGGF